MIQLRRKSLWPFVMVPMLAILACNSDSNNPQTASATTVMPSAPAIQSPLRIPEDIPDSPVPAVAAADIRTNSHQYGYGRTIHVYGEMVELYRNGGECFALLKAGVSLEYKSCDSTLHWKVGNTIAALCTMGQYNTNSL